MDKYRKVDLSELFKKRNSFKKFLIYDVHKMGRTNGQPKHNDASYSYHWHGGVKMSHSWRHHGVDTMLTVGGTAGKVEISQSGSQRWSD